MAAGNTNRLREMLWSRRNIKVRNDWLEACTQFLINENQGTIPSPGHLCELVYQQWLVADLREIGVSVLPDGVAESVSTTLQGPLCLQINLAVNVGESAYSQIQKMKGQDDPESFQENKPNWEASKPTRMLILELTDGVNNVTGMEYRPIPTLKPSTPPGSKVKISGKVICRLGCLLLTSENIALLGGEVSSLKEENSAWNLLHHAIGQEPPQIPLQAVEPDLSINDEQIFGASHPKSSLPCNRLNAVNASHPMTDNSKVDKRKLKNRCAREQTEVFNGIMQNRNRNFSQSGPIPSSNCWTQNRTEQNPEVVVNDNDDIDSNDDLGLIEDFIEFEDDFEINALEQIEKSVQMQNGKPGTHQLQTEKNNMLESQMMQNSTVLKGDLCMDDFCDEIFLNDNVDGDFEIAAAEIETQLLSSQLNKPVEKNSLTDSSSIICIDDDDDDDFESLTQAVQPRKKRNTSSVEFDGNCNVRSYRSSTNSGSVRKFSDKKLSRQSLTSRVKDNTQTKLSAFIQPVRRKATIVSTGEDQNPRPFSYLAEIFQVDKSTKTRIVRVKAYIATVVSHSRSTNSDWRVTVKLNDGTAVVDADIINKDVLAKLLGFNADEFLLQDPSSECLQLDLLSSNVDLRLAFHPYEVCQVEMEEACKTEEPSLRQRFGQKIGDFQANLASISCLIDLELSPLTHRPSIVKIIEPTAADVTALLHCVTSKLVTNH